MYLMENRNIKPYQHLSLQDRYDIEEGLNRNYSFSRIADMLQRDRTTISKEVFKRRVGTSLRSSLPNDCQHKVQCPRLHLCPDCPHDRRCCTAAKPTAVPLARTIPPMPAAIQQSFLSSVTAAAWSMTVLNQTFITGRILLILLIWTP